MNCRQIKLVSTLLLGLYVSGVMAQPEDSPNQNPEQNYSQDNQWGQSSAGAWDGSTSWITADGNGLIYVLVRIKPYVRIFDREGTFLRSWSGSEELGSAHSITIDQEDNAWISDSARHVIRKYNTNGDLMMTLGLADQPGDNSSTDKFNQPNHVFIADNGDIYISDGYVNSPCRTFQSRGRIHSQHRRCQMAVALVSFRPYTA